MSFTLSYYSYSLAPDQSPFSKQGLLLKYQEDNGAIKYADCSPWPTLGDQPLEAHLKILKTERSVSELIKSALNNAPYWSESLGPELSLHPLFNHTLVTKTPYLFKPDQQFSVLKVKIGRAPAEEVSWLSAVTYQYPQVKWRLDANALFSYQQWSDFWEQLPAEVKVRIEYVEDPFEYDVKLWSHWNQIVPLALDFATEPHLADPASFQIYVFKPSRQSQEVLHVVKNKSIAVTSHLGHAIDCLNSLYFYQVLEQQGYSMVPIVGCLNQNIYHDPFYRVMKIQQGLWLNLEKSLMMWDQYLKSEIKWLDIGEIKLS